MIERLDGMPRGTVGFRIDGDVEDEDYTERSGARPQGRG